jgi:ribonucleotide reductase beta subunit family protein with ferritin-like domain
MIKYSLPARDKIVKSKTAMTAIQNLLKFESPEHMTEEFEADIYTFLKFLVKDETDFKDIIGKDILAVMKMRIEAIN